VESGRALMTEHASETGADLRLRLLVLRCQAGDERAFAQLMTAFQSRTLRYLQGWSRRRETDDDFCPRDKLPADAQRMRTWDVSQWQHYADASNPSEYEELAALRTQRLSGEAILGDVPLVVLTRGTPDGSTQDRDV
jgi:hypothetical protein